MREKKTLKIIAVVLGVIVLFSFVKGKTTPKKKPSMEELGQKVEQKILSLDLVNYAKDGTKKWQLKGDSADILAEVVNLTTIAMETYEDPKINLTALKGSYNRKNKEITLFDDVVVLTSEGARITTDYLKWDGKTDTITTDKPVKIVRSDVIAYGDGALVYPQMKKVILNENVKVKLATNVIKDASSSPKEEEKPLEEDGPAKATITCKGPLEIDYEKNIAIFKNDVLVDDKKGKIYSDKMVAFLDPSSKNILKVVAEGDVRVVRGRDSTFSQKAIYTTKDQKIILVGRPRIFIRSSIDEVDTLERDL